MLEDYIWAAIIKSFTVHSTTINSPKEIKRDTKIKTIFPTVNNKDEQANRLGMSLLNILFFLNRKYSKNETIDYKPRKEFELFKNVEDVFDYFYNKYK